MYLNPWLKLSEETQKKNKTKQKTRSRSLLMHTQLLQWKTRLTSHCVFTQASKLALSMET